MSCKTCAYVFDFAPDRTLKMVTDAVTLNSKAGKTKADDKNRLGEFLNFCPVIGIEGSTMKPYKVSSLLQQLKSAYAERVVTKGFDDAVIYNDELLKLSKVELEKFSALQAIIGQTKANKAGDKIDVNRQGLTEEEYEQSLSQPEKRIQNELTPEEQTLKEKLQEAKKQRQSAISILRGISIRMPLLIYGARGKNGDEIPITEDITIKKFVELVDDTSWQEFMPRGVTKENFADFEKYYDEDVFIAAGKRIRNLVIAADKLNVTERTKRIAELFSYFKNPDKETVLTPWRVVNMHMGDCLGGYSFFDKNYEQPLGENEPPHFISIKDVTEKTLGNSEAKILEINSKTGLYPLYCAYSILRAKKAKSASVEQSPAMIEQNSTVVEPVETTTEESLWQETIRENIYVICKTPMAKAITQRTLCGFTDIKINAHAFDHLVNDLKNKSDTFIKDITSENFWKKGNGKMEFDVIVGNPPYQEMDGGAGTSAGAVYNLFVKNAIKVKPSFISMIMPARWYAGGKGLDDFRSLMLNDKRIKVLVDFPNCNDLFPSVDIAGGICYFLRNDKDSEKCIVKSMNRGNCIVSERDLNEYEIFVRDNKAMEIIKKVNSMYNKTLETRCSSRKPFGLATNYPPKDKGIPCWFIQKIGKKYANLKDIDDSNNLLDKWKFLVPKSPIARQTDFTKPVGFYYDGNTKIAAPGECCTESFIVLGAFNTEEEVLNYKSYILTKTVRFLLLQAVVSQDVTKKCFCFVPDLEQYSKKYTDTMLCKLWNITDEEWNYIDSRICNIKN